MTRRQWAVAASLVRSATHDATWLGVVHDAQLSVLDMPAGPLRATRDATRDLAIEDYRDVNAWRWRRTEADTWTLEVEWA